MHPPSSRLACLFNLSAFVRFMPVLAQGRDSPLLPSFIGLILMGLTAFITTVVVEAVYFVCHLWRCLFDGSALSFSWVEPLPAAGIYTSVVLLMGFITGRLMSRASEEELDSVRETCAALPMSVHSGLPAE